MMKLFPSFLLGIFVLVSISFAEGHAFLDHAEPRVGSTLDTAPSEVRVWMTEELEATFSKLQVFDAKGDEVDKKDVKVSGAVMTVSIPKLAAGIYLVTWKAVASDTHKTSGKFNFTVR